jgi:hypothetical protein
MLTKRVLPGATKIVGDCIMMRPPRHPAQFGGTKPLRVFAALAAAKTGLDGRGDWGTGAPPQIWNFQVGRLGGGVMASLEMGLVSLRSSGLDGDLNGRSWQD